MFFQPSHREARRGQTKSNNTKQDDFKILHLAICLVILFQVNRFKYNERIVGFFIKNTYVAFV